MTVGRGGKRGGDHIDLSPKALSSRFHAGQAVYRERVIGWIILPPIKEGVILGEKKGGRGLG
jgi:hypothetical protein